MAEHSDTDVALIYLASTGRSGSTLLELLLNTLSGVWTVGEVFVLPWEVMAEEALCGCGRKLTECRFRSPIIQESGATLSVDHTVALFRDGHRSSKFFRSREVARLIFNKGFTDRDVIDEFSSENRQLFAAVRARACTLAGEPIRYVVDASKDSYRLNWLLHSKGVTVRTIHLVHDPRAFVYAKIKKERPGLGRLRIVVRMSVRYVITHYLIERACRHGGDDSYYLLRYEDLASHPEEHPVKTRPVVESACQEGLSADFRDVENHGIAGNQMRGGEGE